MDLNFWLRLSEKQPQKPYPGSPPVLTRIWVRAMISLLKSHCWFASQVEEKFNCIFSSLGPLCRASDISRKKKQNFAGFSGANSRKYRPILWGKSQNSQKNRTISQEKSQNSQKNRPISQDFSGKKVNFQRIFRGKFLEKSADFTGNFGGNFTKKQSVKNSRFRWTFFGKFR